MTITVYIPPPHIKQEAREWMLSDSRWRHLIDAVRKWIEFSSSCLFSLVLLALLLFYYYTLLYVHATFSCFFFFWGSMEKGQHCNPMSSSCKKKCWVLLYLVIRDGQKLNQLLELRAKHTWANLCAGKWLYGATQRLPMAYSTEVRRVCQKDFTFCSACAATLAKVWGHGWMDGLGGLNGLSQLNDSAILWHRKASPTSTTS